MLNIDPEQLVKENYHWMQVLAVRFMGEKAIAEDVVQEAFINALRGLTKFSGRSSIKTWLHKIVVNQCISKLRQLNRLEESSIDQYQPIFDEFDCRIETEKGVLASPEQILEKQDIIFQIEEALATLPEAFSIVIKLRDIEGFDTKEVANLLGISEANVKVRLHRGRAALKKLLEPIMLDRGL